MSLHHCSACVSSSFCHHRFIRQKDNHSNSFGSRSNSVLIFDLTCLNTPRIFMILEWARDEVYEAALNATQGSVFFPCSRGEGKEEEGGIWLLSPHPQSVRGGFRKKGTKTWDAEITRDTNIEIPAWQCRARIIPGFYFLFFFHWGDSGASHVRGKEYKSTGNNMSILYSVNKWLLRRWIKWDITGFFFLPSGMRINCFSEGVRPLTNKEYWF